MNCLQEILPIFFDRPAHFPGKVTVVFSAAECLNPGSKVPVRTVFLQHFLQFCFLHRAVPVFVDNVFLFAAFGFFPVFLLLYRIAENQHGSGEYIGREVKEAAVEFALFHNIAYVAGEIGRASGRERVSINV